jgi:hypothetical protein
MSKQWICQLLYLKTSRLNNLSVQLKQPDDKNCKTKKLHKCYAALLHLNKSYTYKINIMIQLWSWQIIAQ